MKKEFKLKKLSFLICGLLCIPFITSLSSCGSSGDNSYNIKVTAFDDYILNNINVELYSNNNLVASGITDSNGIASIKVEKYGEYNISLSGLADGFDLDGSYITSSKGNDINVNCISSLIDDDIPSNTTYELGSNLYDFSFTTSTGSKIKASEVLKTKKAIFINMWFINCQYCDAEFPLIQSFYEENKDDIEFVAINPFDTLANINDYKTKKGYTFEMTIDSVGFVKKFNVSGYPTSIIIDKYGICSAFQTATFRSSIDLNYFFDDILKDDYKPSYLASYSKMKEATEVMPDSSSIEEAINSGSYSFSYYGSDDKYVWPFVVSSDGDSIKPSNNNIDSSYSMIMSDFSMKSNQALLFDYNSLTEKDNDCLYVYVDGVKMCEISGDSNGWKTICPYVSLKSGKHQLILIYNKNESISYQDDSVYIKNIRIEDASSLSEPVNIIRSCFKGASSLSGAYMFVDPIYNEVDGLYHADSLDGSIIYVDLLEATIWADYSLYDLATRGLLNDVNGKDYNDLIIRYAEASKSSEYKLSKVNQELYEAIDTIAQYNPLVSLGDNEWLLMCSYFQSYGTNN